MKTSPVRIANALRYIAEGIDKTRRPSISLVAHDLQYVRLALEGFGPKEISARLADDGGQSTEALAKLLWNNPEGKSVDEAYRMTKKQTDDEKLITSLNGLKTDISEFITRLEQGLGKSGKKTTRQQIQEDEDSGDVMTSAPPMKR